MKMNEESSFLQGIESRLDSLFAEDTQPIKEKDSDPPQKTAPEVASDVTEDIQENQEIQDIKETSSQSEITSEPIPAQDKSSFISEIEKRFSAIFGEDDKDVSPVKIVAESNELQKAIAQAEQTEPDDLKNIIAQAEQVENIKPDQSLGDFSSAPSSILLSPLKDMKSIILSIEWEINDHILEQLEDEINKMYLLYTGDRIIQGFLRILRFLGRYIRVRGVRSNQDSINLLLYVYDHLENVMVSEGMTEAKKHIILLDNVKRYRAWVESTDLETDEETQVSEADTSEVKSLEFEPLEKKTVEGQQVDIKPLAEISEINFTEEEPTAAAVVGKAIEGKMSPLTEISEIKFTEEEPIVEAVVGNVIEDDLSPLEGRREEKAEVDLKEIEMAFLTPSAPVSEIAQLAVDGDVKDAISAMKDLPPHEAFVYALEELKKTFRSELDALKEEIRILKSTR